MLLPAYATPLYRQKRIHDYRLVWYVESYQLPFAYFFIPQAVFFDEFLQKMLYQKVKFLKAGFALPGIQAE